MCVSILYIVFLDPPNSAPKRYLVRFGRFCLLAKLTVVGDQHTDICTGSKLTSDVNSPHLVLIAMLRCDLQHPFCGRVPTGLPSGESLQEISPMASTR